MLKVFVVCTVIFLTAPVLVEPPASKSFTAFWLSFTLHLGGLTFDEGVIGFTYTLLRRAMAIPAIDLLAHLPEAPPSVFGTTRRRGFREV